jgi:bile acid:Na+ symporter, BASS family
MTKLIAVKKLTLHAVSIGLAMLAVLTALVFWKVGALDLVGPCIILFFLLLAFGFRGFEQLKGYVFTVMIFAAVTTSLFYPQYFTQWGEFKLSGLIIPLLQVIMFGMGTSMSINDFVAVVKMPKGVLIGVVAQFSIMPVIGLFLANLSGLPPEIAAGIILVGCSPSGVASNVMAFLARANLALSISLTACTTLLAPFVTPLLMNLLAGQFIEINVTNMMLDISKIILLPIAAGLVFNKLTQGKAAWLKQAMPLVSMSGIALIIVVITAAGRDSLLSIGPLLIFIALTHNTLGYMLGYWSARLLKMSERDARTVAIEVGLQNAGLASGIAKGMGKIATVGLAAGVFGPVMNITGSMLSSYWHKRLPEGAEAVKV